MLDNFLCVHLIFFPNEDLWVAVKKKGKITKRGLNGWPFHPRALVMWKRMPETRSHGHFHDPERTIYECCETELVFIKLFIQTNAVTLCYGGQSPPYITLNKTKRLSSCPVIYLYVHKLSSFDCMHVTLKWPLFTSKIRTRISLTLVLLIA